jgi:hypothetical protein
MSFTSMPSHYALGFLQSLVLHSLLSLSTFLSRYFILRLSYQVQRLPGPFRRSPSPNSRSPLVVVWWGSARAEPATSCLISCGISMFTFDCYTSPVLSCVPPDHSGEITRTWTCSPRSPGAIRYPQPLYSMLSQTPYLAYMHVISSFTHSCLVI